MGVLEERIAQLTSRIERLENENYKLNKEIQDNKRNNEELNQYIRRESIEIHNVPDIIDQSVLENFVINIGERLGVRFTSYEIAACHRLCKRKGDRFQPVIVRFTNRKFVQSLMDGRHLLPIRTNFYWGQIWFTENLIPPRRRVLRQLEHLRKEKLVQHYGSWNGLPHFTMDGKKYKVTNTRELDKLIKKIAPD